MDVLHWLEFCGAAYLVATTIAIWSVLRVQGYTADQRRLQVGLAILLPFLGAIAVYVMAREADAPLPKPKPSTHRFDRAGD